MKLIKLMFASIYSVYFKSENEDTPIFRAIAIFVFIQFCLLFFLYTFVATFFRFKSFYDESIGPILVVITIILLFVLNALYFTEKRVELVYKKFAQLPQPRRRSIAVFVILIAVLLPIASLLIRAKFR